MRMSRSFKPRLLRAFGGKGLGKSSNEIPLEIAYFGTVGDSMPRATTVEHDFIGKIRIEGGVIDLANNRRQLGNPHGRRKFVVEVLEGAILLGGVIGEVPLIYASRENGDAHDLNLRFLPELLLHLDVPP